MVNKILIYYSITREIKIIVYHCDKHKSSSPLYDDLEILVSSFEYLLKHFLDTWLQKTPKDLS